MKQENLKSLSGWENQKIITDLKMYFINELCNNLNLHKIEAPLIVEKGTGINDDLNGIENPVSVNVKNLPNVEVEVVHSLAKWKRLVLGELSVPTHQGIYADMRALRPDEDFSNVHSIFVDQWDWEKVIDKADRNLDYLENTVREIYKSILSTENFLLQQNPSLKSKLPSEIFFIHSEELLKMYPNLTPKERENEICKLKGAVFLIGIGNELSDGKKHDGRAPDYDDWSTINRDGQKGLNGDILVWNEILNSSFEISSMGIRVDENSLLKQLEITENNQRMSLDWHKKLINNELPYTIGGGIGQSRLCMFLLEKNHIKEVQFSVWPTNI